ncbi:MAG: PAS domain-containing protein [Flammeovirgaceae bacterium]
MQNKTTLEQKIRQALFKKILYASLVIISIDFLMLIFVGSKFWFGLLPAIMLHLIVLKIDKTKPDFAAPLFFWVHLIVIVGLSATVRNLNIIYALVPHSCAALLILKNKNQAVVNAFICVLTLIAFSIIDRAISFVADPELNYQLVSLVPITSSSVVLIFELIISLRIVQSRREWLENSIVANLKSLQKKDIIIEEQAKQISKQTIAIEDLYSLNKQLEFVLSQKSKELQTYLNAMNNSICYILFGLDYKLIKVNKYTEQLCEHSEYLLAGQNINKFLFADQQEQLYNEILVTINKGEVWRGDVKGYTAKNKLFYIDTIITPIKDGNGEILYFMILGLPVTEKRVFEMQQKQITTALESIAFKSSHKIRGPMARIQGILNLAEKNYLKPHEIFSSSKLIISNLEELDQATSELTYFVNNHYDSLNKIQLTAHD